MSWIEGTSKEEQCVPSVVHIIIILRNPPSPAVRTCKFCTLLTVMFCSLPATTNSLCSPWFCVRLPDMIDLVVRWQSVLINVGSAEGRKTRRLSLNSFFVLKDFFVFARHLGIAQREPSCPNLVFNYLFKEKEQPCTCALSGACTNIFLFYTFAMCLSVHPPVYRHIFRGCFGEIWSRKKHKGVGNKWRGRGTASSKRFLAESQTCTCAVKSQRPTL